MYLTFQTEGKCKLEQLKLNEKALERQVKNVTDENLELQKKLKEVKMTSQRLLEENKKLKEKNPQLVNQQINIQENIDRVQVEIKDEQDKFVHDLCKVILAETEQFGQFLSFAMEHLFPGSTSEEIQRCICELSSRSQVAYKMLNASTNSISNQAENNNLLEWFKFMEQLKMALKIGIGPNYATLGLEVVNPSNP